METDEKCCGSLRFLPQVVALYPMRYVRYQEMESRARPQVGNNSQR